MNFNYTKIAAWVGLVVALVTFGKGYVASNSASFGNTYKSVASQVYVNPYDYSGGLQIGQPSQATMRVLVRDNVCNAVMVGAVSFAATTSRVFICSDAYVRSGDIIDVRLPNVNGGFSLTGESYATTTGYFAFGVVNELGVATSSFSQSTTSIPYTIIRTQ